MGRIEHTWAVFRRTRTGIFAVTGFLDLALAIIVLVALLSDWAAHDPLQRALSSVVFFINLFSTLCFILLCLLRIRPMVDLGCVCSLFVFQIGAIVAYTLAAPFLPCAGKGIMISCKFHQSFVLYGSCVSCVLLCLFLLFLFPILRLPPQNPPVVPILWPDEKTLSDSASSLTYYSWDRNPNKKFSDTSSSWSYQASERKASPPPKHLSLASHYSQASEHASPYNFSLQGRTTSPLSQKPLMIKKHGISSPSPSLPRSLAASPQRPARPLDADSSKTVDGMAYLRPYSPPPMDRKVQKAPIRGSVTSMGSQDTGYAASWLMEPPRAKLSSPKQSTGSMPEPVLRPSPSPALSSRRLPKAELIKAKLAAPKKQKPMMLSIDPFRDPDSVTLSDVPRSPSLIATSPHSPFPPTPHSGMLPKHPRLTMHMREVSLAQSPSNSPRM
ncbi:hypothetical protein DFP72DRAFT_332512 [Ephemerocybe angulata]|uniref:Uncharacterized protein n=1 Tax=Ephemerocybe angulata TaxID=980116 RepID=A0A8H6MG47_9AGAR|nr:hypothetical protein DFP72DRAFT_332512 [Tulosesus angulatus]